MGVFVNGKLQEEKDHPLNNRNIVNSLQSYDILESVKYAGCNEIKHEISLEI
jgi:hypothetical protein